MASAEYSQVGQAKANIKSWEKAAGTAQYCDDIRLPRMLYGRILRSTHPHAKIVTIDTSKAEALPGVVAVITGEEIRDKVKPYGIVERDELPLQPDKVRYVGDEVAAVAAESPKIAAKALKLIDVTYEPLPFVLDAEEAVKPGAPLVHEHANNNILQTVPVRGGKDIETGLSEADHVFEYVTKTQKATAAPLEPHGAVADYNPHTQKIRLWLCSQNYTLDRLAIAESLGIGNNKIQVLAPPVGGAFGQKCDGLAHAFCAIFLSMKTLQPVKMILDMKEEFMATRNRHPITRKTKVGVKEDGTITAWKEDIFINTGAYASFGPTVALFQGHIIQGAYKFPSVSLDAHAIYTNMSNAGAYRGFSEPAVVFARESIIDDIAARINVDRIAIRMRNIIKTEDLPFTTSTGQKVRSCIAQECLEKALDIIKWEEKEKNKEPYHGLGVATMTQWCGARFHPGLDCDFETSIVRLNDDGTVNVHTGGMVDLGTGVHTTIAQVVAEELGIEVEDINIIDGDSDTSGQGQGNYADRGIVIGGSAAKLAAVEARKKILQAAAEILEASPDDLVLENRKVAVKGSPERSISLKEICLAKHYTTQGGTPGAIVGEASWDAPTEMLDEKGCGDYCPTYLFAATTAEVKVDPDTGQVEILNLITVHDPGTIINPTIVEGQVEGGVSQAIGYILSEELKYEKETGRLLNPNYRDYVIPTAMDMPDVTPVFVKDIDTELAQFNHGQKGIGETPCNGPSGALANAISDAIGVRMTSLPITPEKIVKALKEKKQNNAP